jgi:putative addiction module component (TIGR02574 family)
MIDSPLLATLLALPETERVQLVEKLLESLGADTDAWDESAFAEELRRRSLEVEEGKAELLSWEQLKNEAI